MDRIRNSRRRELSSQISAQPQGQGGPRVVIYAIPAVQLESQAVVGRNVKTKCASASVPEVDL
jgi:hypothetical protein